MADALKVAEYSRREQDVAGWSISIETYRLGEVYHCTISSVDPGARVARAGGSSKAEAEERARQKAQRYLVQTRRLR